jgi:tRNA-specific 2-thiouridylase
VTGLSAFDDHLAAPRGLGRLAGAPHSGAAGGSACGDIIRVAVRVEGGRIAEAGFAAEGCGALTAAGSAIVELVDGGPVLAAALVTPGSIADELGGLIPPKRHAATLAAEALHRALAAVAVDGALRLEPSRNRTLVAMSGGVDSAVAARLALDAGHEVVAVTLELWADPAHDGERSCCSPQAVAGARALAQQMGIPHLTLDLRDRFRAAVVDDFVAGHAAGETPNPCVRCNGLVRFDAMLALADRLGAGRLATGHYARVGADDQGPLLRAAADPAKDQTYMLARLSSEELERVWFPLGELDKPHVREVAREAGLPVADKPESQDLCFLAGVNRQDFLRRQAGSDEGVRPGEIVSLDGRVLGRHEGHERFTVGQRRGLGVAAREPLYVVGKDARSNRVTVGPRSALATAHVALRDARLTRAGAAVDRVKLRYRSAPVPCRVQGDLGAGAHERVELELARQVDGVAAGQMACLMRGDRVLGWATIAGPGQGAAGGAANREIHAA